MIVTLKHLRSVPGWTVRSGYCSQGARQWCARHGVDWAEFVRNGIDAERLRATGDAMALRLVEWAEEVEHGGRR